MKYISAIYIWIVGIISFLIIFTLIFILNLFLSKNSLFKFLSFSCKIALWFMLLRFKVNFEQKLDTKKSYIFMPNHTSMMDVLILSAYMPVFANAIEAHKHFKWFIYGWIIKIFEQIPINRTSARESIRSFQIAKERLQKGRSIIVFPEGTRSKKSQMNNFKKLPFKFAIESGFAVVPVAMKGVDKASPENIWVKPAKIIINFGTPLEADEIANLTQEELSDQVRKKIEYFLTQ